MTSAATVIGEARAATGLTRAAFARLAGVAPSTITRIERGELDPTWGALTGMLTAAGFQPGYPLRSAGDVSAVAAGQYALGDDINLDDDARDWLNRWARAGIVNDRGRATSPGKVGALAGVAARITDRPDVRGAVAYTGDWAAVQRALDESGVSYAVTGIDALDETQDRPRSASPTVYVDNVDLVLEQTDPAVPGGRRVILIELKKNRSLPARVRNGVRYVAPRRALIDAYSAAGRAPDQADAFANSVAAASVSA